MRLKLSKKSFSGNLKDIMAKIFMTQDALAAEGMAFLSKIRIYVQ